MMRAIRPYLLFSSMILLLAASAPGYAADLHNGTSLTPPQAHFTEAERAALKRISATLNTIQSVQGRFTQIGADGRSVLGTFYLKKPGRVRFEYQAPNPTLVIADGTTVAVENTALHTTDRYPLLNSPLRLLLSDNIDLASDPRIVNVKQDAGTLSMTARETSGPSQGSITLTFADAGVGNLELRQWDVVDAQGAHTTVIVNEMHPVANIPARLFVIEDLSPFKKNEN
jgi:outer membrane lipoprotein-sorting protein